MSNFQLSQMITTTKDGHRSHLLDNLDCLTSNFSMNRPCHLRSTIKCGSHKKLQLQLKWNAIIHGSHSLIPMWRRHTSIKFHKEQQQHPTEIIFYNNVRDCIYDRTEATQNQNYNTTIKNDTQQSTSADGHSKFWRKSCTAISNIASTQWLWRKHQNITNIHQLTLSDHHNKLWLGLYDRSLIYA